MLNGTYYARHYRSCLRGALSSITTGLRRSTESRKEFSLSFMVQYTAR
jgi:hypothetical protein